jgi:hypothetical protein
MKQFFIILFLLPSLLVFAQDYNYIHYDTKDGLAGTTVYNLYEDKKGYIWFATDNGVSRFDGKNFTNFTTDDGLPDNEVLNVFCDSKNRVWCMTFNKSLGYISDNKFYTIRINKELSEIFLTSSISVLAEDTKGNIYFHTKSGIIVYRINGEIGLVADYRKIGYAYNLPMELFAVLNIQKMFPNNLYLIAGNIIFQISDTAAVFLRKIKSNYISKKGALNFANIDSNFEPIFPKTNQLYNYNSITYFQNQIFFNTADGSRGVDTIGNLTGDVFLKGKKVSNSFMDAEGSIWFTTLGEGIYRLTSGSMKSFAGDTEAFSIEKSGDRIFAGLADGRMKIIRNCRMEGDYKPLRFPELSNSRRLYTLKKGLGGKMFLGFDSHLEIWNNGRLNSSPIRPIKSIDLIDENNILISTNFYVLKAGIPGLEIRDTLFRERGTKVLYDHGKFYIGTLTGFVIIDSAGGIIKSANQSPLLSNRVVDIKKAPDGSLWIASNNNGVIHYQDGEIKAVVNHKNGLSSNGCRSMFLKDQYLWVGTNKGINKIDTRSHKVIAKYTVSDGLPSDNINALYVEDSLVWVASPGGLTFFNEHNISDSSICKLDFHTILVSGLAVDTSGKLELKYRQNNISFSYTAISFKSAGEIIYKYKLTGLDDDWNETSQTTLSYPSLPPGNYTFQLYAINKFGKQSEMVTIPFSISAPFWKTIWFWLLISLSLIWVTALLISRRYRSIQKRLKEKNELNRKVAELEQASLRAQMNPHFIFNCLNSIQHFIIKNDIEQTNKYITQFGSLIRQTLDNAARTSITIADEIKYLTGYMELERMRFPEAFRYQIEIDHAIQADYVCVPSMILQPFVENAIRHGIRNKEKGTGLVKIMIREDNEGIHFTVEDNGVGREAAARFKSLQHIEYQSKGITLATNRLELLSESSGERIIIAFTDMKDGEDNACGTKVDIFFPHNVIEKLN